MTAEIQTVLPLGPEAYNNWRSWVETHEGWFACEYPLFTDAHVTGQLSDGHGPYQFLNAVPISLGESLAPAIILRVAMRAGGGGVPSMEKTDDSRYHGGSLIDEIAALLSLHMGIRIKAGKSIRMFFPEGDPRGSPEAFEMIPDLVTPRSQSLPIVPRARGQHALPETDLLRRFIELAPTDAVALVLASRLYQDALWVCETQPALAWLFMVSAAEAAANHWRQTEESPVERLRASKPELAGILTTAGGEDHLRRVAEQIAPYMGATKKFIDFVLEFLPDPPSDRPPQWAQCPWDKQSIKKAMGKIYDYRSKALHGGTPFPLPMCGPPKRKDHELAEKPTALATSGGGGVWVAEDLPMLLSTFEYIIRNVLLRWWRSMLERNTKVIESAAG